MKIFEEYFAGCAPEPRFCVMAAGSCWHFDAGSTAAGQGASMARDHSGSPRRHRSKTVVYSTLCTPDVLATMGSSTYHRRLSKDLRFQEVRRFQRDPNKTQQRPFGALGEGERVLAPHVPRPATAGSSDRYEPPTPGTAGDRRPGDSPAAATQEVRMLRPDTAVVRVQRHRSMAVRAAAMNGTKRSETAWHHNCLFSSARNQSRRVSGSTNEEMAR